jgi:histidine phosphotransferase ChpT
MTVRPDLSALLGSRICHDLISPLGAIGNGVELLTMTLPAAAPEIALITESVDNANARIRFFRIAYGAATPGHKVPEAEIRSVLSDMSRGARVTIDWTPRGDVDRPIAKLIFLGLQCLEAAVPWGGQITVAERLGHWSLTAEAGRTKIDSDLWEAVGNPGSSARVTSADIQFALITEAATLAGRTLRSQLGDTRLDLTF